MPVRIALDAEQVRAHPLRVGLSMLARVDVRTGTESAEMTEPAPGSAQGVQTGVFESASEPAQAHVQAIIARHLGAEVAKAQAEPQQ